MSGFTLRSYRTISSDNDILYRFDITDRHEKIHNNLSYFKTNNWDEYTNKDIPSVSGIYSIVVTDTNLCISEVAYIGCSQKLSIRLYSHTILRFLSEMLESHLKCSLYIYETEDYKLKEQEFIRVFMPIFNSEYKPDRFYIKNDKRKRNKLKQEISNG